MARAPTRGPESGSPKAEPVAGRGDGCDGAPGREEGLRAGAPVFLLVLFCFPPAGVRVFWALIRDAFFPGEEGRKPLQTAVSLALLVGIGAIALLAYAIGATPPSEAPPALVPGMSYEEVSKAQGEPSSTAAGSETELWFYPDGTRLTFKDGSLTEWELPEE